MTREDFRRELGDAMDSISGSPDPALSDRVRAALVEAPERRGPVWIAAVAAAVIAVILVGVLVVGNPLNRGPLIPGGQVKVTPTTTPATTPKPSTGPTASPLATPFVCSQASAFITRTSPPPLALIDDVRTGKQTGYDRLVIEFKNGQPGSIELRPQTGTTFTNDPKGDQIKLAGNDGLLITMKGADSHTDYSKSTDLKPGYTELLEVRKVGDFEGVVQWAVGLSKPACYRADILTSPTRLVLDFQAS
jgi:hypothetical protein